MWGQMSHHWHAPVPAPPPHKSCAAFMLMPFSYRFQEEDVVLMHTVLTVAGFHLRSEDPITLKVRAWDQVISQTMWPNTLCLTCLNDSRHAASHSSYIRKP